jgi:polar amino acid transport system substrate-binding protein
LSVARTALKATWLATLGLTLTGPVIARPLDEVKAAGDLRVAVYSDNAPFSDVRDGRQQGIDVDLAKAVADKLGLRLDLRLVDAGENVDGDFRLNLWRGDLAGSPLADLMLHVPHDKILATRNEQIFLTTPYFDQHLAYAYRRDKLEGFDAFRDVEGYAVAVEGASASDMVLLMADGGRYRANLKHFRSFEEAAKAYLAGEAPILAGSRPSIEAALHDAKLPEPKAPGSTPPESKAPEANAVVEITSPGLVKTRWDLGGAVRSDSRDLAYAVGDAITALIADGTMKAICAKYGVEYRAPQGY